MQHKPLALFVAWTFLCGSAGAADLLEIWARAQGKSPEISTAELNREISQSDVDISLSKLLPNARYLYSKGDSSTEREPTSGSTPAHTDNYKIAKQQLLVTQPIFRPQDIFALRQARASAKATDSEFDQAKSDFAVRIASAYFEAASNFEQYRLGEKRTQVLRGLLEFAEKSLKHGTGTRSDVEDAQAKLDIALADHYDLTNSMLNASRNLTTLSTVSTPPSELATLAPGKLRFLDVTPDDFSFLMKNATEDNPGILAARQKLDAADENVSAQYSGHLPTVDLSFNQSDSQNETESTIGSRFKTNSLTLQVNVPLFLGGQTLAMASKASAQRSIARNTLEQSLRKLEIELSKELSNITQGPIRIKALENALRSANNALNGSKKGLQAGTRNIVDVLNAQQQSYSTQNQLIKARYEYATAVIRFKGLLGQLNQNAFEQVNAWLAKGSTKSDDTL